MKTIICSLNGLSTSQSWVQFEMTNIVSHRRVSGYSSLCSGIHHTSRRQYVFCRVCGGTLRIACRTLRFTCANFLSCRPPSAAGCSAEIGSANSRRQD